ncbi:MAG: hypothetical protein R3182_09915, partial [Draconibacterium sp.]|nr:hypothetical protein [Draconibacterium sp.]
MKFLYNYLLEHFRDVTAIDFLAKPMAALVCIVAMVVVAWLAHFITRQIFLRIVARIAKRTKTQWDDILVKNKVFRGMAHLVPAIIIYYTADFSYPVLHQEISELEPEVFEALSKDYYWGLTGVLLKIARIYLTMIIVFVANSVLNSAYDIYNTTEYSFHRPIKGYIQLVKIFVYFMAGIMIIAILLERDPSGLLTGLG